MNRLATIASAGLVCFLPLAASAASLSPGLYTVENMVDNVGETRTFWFDPLLATGGPGPASRFWAVTDATFDYQAAGDSTLSGTAENVDDSSIGFDFSFTMISPTVGGTGYCQFGPGSAGDCGPGNGGDDVDPTMWTFFDLTDGMLEGTGDLAGATWDIDPDDSGTHPFQIGLDANALVLNGLNGISGWFDWSRTSGDASLNGYSLASSGNGDVNANLVSPPPGVVPLPASAWLLLGAMGVGAAVSRKRRS